MQGKASITALLLAMFLSHAATALASTTWYADGVNGNDGNNCMSPTAACKTIRHVISLAAPGDIMFVAAATYPENLTISISLNIIGSGATTTIVDGGRAGKVFTISSATAKVSLSKLTMRNGNISATSNVGTLTINASSITNNSNVAGGGVNNVGSLTINDSTISGNGAENGGGIYNNGTLNIDNSTINQNSANYICLNYFQTCISETAAVLAAVLVGC